MELHIVSIYNYFQPSVCLYFSQRTFSFFKESWSGYFRQKIGPGTMEGYFWLFKKRLFIKHRNGLIGEQCTLIWGYHSPVQHRRSFPILSEVLLDETLQLQDPPVAAVGFRFQGYEKINIACSLRGLYDCFDFTAVLCSTRNIHAYSLLERSIDAYPALRRNWENWKVVEPKSEESHNRTIFDILQFGTHPRLRGDLGNAGFVIILVSQKVPSPTSRLIGLSSSKEMHAP